MGHIARATALVLSVMFIGGCLSSNYKPKSTSRVSVVMHQNEIAYVRNGRMHKHGFLGSGLIDAVRGNPRAERAARSFHERLRDGLIATVGGLVCSTIAMVVAAKGEIGEDDLPSRDYDPTKPMLIAGGCLIVSMVGLFYAVSSAPYRFDAINIFNDDAESQQRPPGMIGGALKTRPAVKAKPVRSPAGWARRLAGPATP